MEPSNGIFFVDDVEVLFEELVDGEATIGQVSVDHSYGILDFPVRDYNTYRIRVNQIVSK